MAGAGGGGGGSKYVPLIFLLLRIQSQYRVLSFQPGEVRLWWWWLFLREREFWENVRRFIPRLRFFFKV